MEIVKQKAIELLLDIISKEDFEVMLYEKVKTEDVVKNKLLFEFVNINYRKDSYKIQLLEILETFLDKKAFIIYKVNLYANNIKDENDKKIIYKNFDKIYDLFEFDLDYNLMWEFYHIHIKIDLVEINYEDESDVLKSLKELCYRVCSKFDKLLSIEEKTAFLIDGFEKNEKAKEDEYETEKVVAFDKKTKSNKIFTAKKWYQFWKLKSL